MCVLLVNIKYMFPKQSTGFTSLPPLPSPLPNISCASISNLFFNYIYSTYILMQHTQTSIYSQN